MVIQNSDAAGEEEAHSQRDDCSNMTLSLKSNQLPVTRRRQPTEIEHDDKITTKTNTRTIVSTITRIEMGPLCGVVSFMFRVVMFVRITEKRWSWSD
jgi:hypothetical protein